MKSCSLKLVSLLVCLAVSGGVLEMLCTLLFENPSLLQFLLCVQLPAFLGLLKLDKRQLVDQCGISFNSQLRASSGTKAISWRQSDLSNLLLLHFLQCKFNSPWNADVESLANLELKLS